MAPLISIDSIITTEYTLPLEIKPRLDLWSSSTCYTWPTKPRRRQVRFGSVECIDHIHVNDFTVEEVQTCWYGSYDYDQFRISNDATIRIIEKKEAQLETTNQPLPLDEDHCTTGLEMMTSKASFMSRRRIQEAIFGVLDAQDYHMYYYGATDPNQLAAIYSSCSERCKEIALWRAERDVQDLPQISIAV